jgi:anti-sigma factor RsiW
MKTETLDSLLMDRALGALSPEIAELLDSYLIQDPDAAQHAANLKSTVELARLTVALPDAPMSPSPSWDRVCRTLRVQRRRVFLAELGKLAACLILGLAVGLASHPVSGSAGKPIAAVAASGSTDSVSRSSVPAEGNGLWSIANFKPEILEQTASGGRLNGRYRLHWDSPVKMPHLEGNL